MDTEIETIYKITLKNGMKYTVKVSKQTESQIIGTDKYNKPIILAVSDIRSMLPKHE